ncbi:hypothetical protein [Halomonas sp. M4R1S46]|uniref:hypothetical protein n=1 Tax=Halomonas sp. M4R1S46 TaxID=2982692 RepID=UPI0021E47EC1|nr:hypothetical protein [Halomonas sp. M4R1S46]UYG06230.1 hypothetical protein OCT48_11340 [Halomonas sp. M4R1S46]
MLLYRQRFLGCAQLPLALRSDHRLVFSSSLYTPTLLAYGLAQELMTPDTPEQSGVV